jgi:hypothetical protein
LEREQRKKQKEKTKREAKKDDPNLKPFVTPPPALLTMLFNLFNGVQVSIDRIHLRYEDDFYNSHRPFSMGLTIEKIHLGNSQSHWTFHTPNGMQFTRTPNDYVNKEFDIVKLRLYVNTMSEMLVPTSLWLATKDTEL